jgi:AraC-like DNA-binding protein
MPFVLFVVILPLLAYKALNNRQIDYGMLSVFDHREKVLTTIQWIYSFVFVLQFAHLGGFLFKNLKVIESYAKNLKLEYSTIDTRIKWLRYFNVLLILLLVLSAIFLYILLISDIYRRHLDYIYVLPIGIIFYFVSFKLMRAEWVSVDTRTKYSGSSLDSKEIPDYIGKLDHIMQNEKVYLNNVIRLSDLAEMTSISKHHLSQILNQHYGLSFYDFVNRFRVQEAKNIISEQPKNTLLQVAFDAGFNNKTSFVNAFKKFENLTPSEFRETIKS